MKFLIKYATRGRAQWFKQVIENIQSTIYTKDYLILVSADLDDPTMNDPDIFRYLKTFKGNLSICFGNSRNKVEAINSDMDMAVDWDILVNMSDDMHFTVHGWDNIIVQRTKDIWGDSMDWFAHFNDGYVGDKLPTMSIMGRNYYNRDGYIYHPSYKSFSCDAEAMYVAMLRGRHHYFSDVLFLHQHPNNRPHPQDQTYRVNSLHTPDDTANYFERPNNNFYTGFTGPTLFDQYKT